MDASSKKRATRAANLAGLDQQNERRRGRPSKKQKQQQQQSLPDESGPDAVIARIAPAAERRRTQLRLAQRAYRLRKENELVSLQKQVATLQKAINDMSRSVVALNEKLTDSGLLTLRPHLSRELHEMAQKFQSLARVTSQEQEKEPEVDNQASSMLKSPPDSVLSYSSSSHDCKPSDVHGEPFQTAVSDPLNDACLAPYQHDINHFQQREARHPQSEIVGLQGLEQASFTMSFPALSRPRYLKPTPTYSFQETSFARRLHRTCIESAYRLLVDSSANPARALKTFGFTLRIWNKSNLIEKFHLLMNRTADESLEDWAVPFFPVGGAGTHYPRRDNGYGLARNVGPLPLHLAHIRHEDKTLQDIASAAGFDGEWFDAYDVEGYLRERGVFLEGHSSFFELPGRQILSPFAGGMGATGFEQTVINPQMMPPGNQLYSQSLPGYSPVIIDVDRFISRLMMRAVCLGRGPGFRQSDVESELYSAIVT
ncbi:hypothetical protein VTN77DRAFT_5114 [Rasamsonia byssochlamydoides]|uniref:uncharacterized protein n=1 Tax=Rasamsonia byssochlamydoides TaxID=89139 RepID=UPI0037432D3D